MSGEAVCLRCDWAGTTSARTCPRCGVALYRPTRKREAARGRGAPRSRGSPRPRASSATLELPPIARRRDRAPEPAARWRGPTLLLGLATVAIVVFVLVRGATPPPRTIPADLTGRLVFATGGPSAQARLYVWDLTADRVREGPLVSGVQFLVDASDSGRRWLGVTQRLADGTELAGVLRFLGAADRVVKLDNGDLASWSADGDHVVTATTNPDSCGFEVRAARTAQDLAAVPLVVLRSDACERVVSVARGGAQAFVSILGPSGSRVVAALGDRETPLLEGFTLVSSSLTHVLLVVPAMPASAVEGRPSGGPSPTVAPSPPEGDTAFTGPLGVYAAGVVAQPQRYEDARGSFQIERFLAWSTDGSHAAVVGHTATSRGTFILDTALANGLSDPRLIANLAAPQAMVAYGVGWFAVSGGDLFLVRPDGSVHLMQLPEGIPAPSGPIAWLP